MNFNEEDIRSDVGFVCIGQAAGNIGLLFEEKGYNVLYINTSSEDLALLKKGFIKVLWLGSVYGYCKRMV